MADRRKVVRLAHLIAGLAVVLGALLAIGASRYYQEAADLS